MRGGVGHPLRSHACVKGQHSLVQVCRPSHGPLCAHTKGWGCAKGLCGGECVQGPPGNLSLLSKAMVWHEAMGQVLETTDFSKFSSPRQPLQFSGNATQKSEEFH